MKNNKFIPGSFLLKMMFVLAFFGVQVQSFAQEDSEKTAREARKYMKEAEEALSENDFASAEAFYRQAIAKDPSNAAARYNLGNLYYNKEINQESAQRHSQAAEVTPEKPVKHNSFHNQGNAFMKQKKYSEAVEAYKNALRNNPKDHETRYNLALAKKMLEEEKQNGEGEDEQNQDENQEEQDQNQDKDQQGDEGEKEQNEDGEPQDSEEGGDEENKDQQEGDDKEAEEGEPKDPQNEENQEQKGDKPQEQQQQPRPGQLSPQQVKNLLDAMGNEEKKVQDKINAEKAKGAKTKSEKDW
ncbi:BatC protein [Salinimicrobium marinum]|uniref:BatC protein n=1 Tax=Salinimicrobium marinum TaxID=680283 RepID=A0A918VTU4_9FLAO|nr:tetratricopeptide repeat protein [Salinimicrobium marinum]GHA23514.1 BatC protein [Salinimicrobium marinum]